MAELESNPNASPLDATPRSRAIFDKNETEAVALDSGHGSYADADSELNLKGEAKLAAADDQAGPQSIAEGEAIILVMGITGVGKSSFINCLTDRDVKIGHGLEPCTSEVEIYPFISRNHTTFLIDTPGFDDTYRSDSEALQEIARFLCQTYANGIKIAGIIYLHSITNCRMTGASIRNLRLLKALCGKTSLSNLVLATSMWDRLSNPEDQLEARAREETLQMDFWKNMLGLGAKIYRHDNTKESALRIVDHIQSLDGSMSLEIQQEMIQRNCKLGQTLAGQQVQKDLFETIAQQKKELLELQNEYVEAMEARNPKWMEYIEKDLRCLSEKIAKLESAKKGLCLDFGSLQEERKGRYQDEVDKFELGKRWQKRREDFTQKHQASVEVSSHNPTWTQYAQSKARKYKRQAAAVVGLGIMMLQTPNLLLGEASMGIKTLVTEVGIWKRMQELAKRIESCGEPLGVTSSDENKNQDQRGGHSRTPNDGEPSSTCSEESRVGDMPPPYPSPAEASQSDKESSQCRDLLSIDASTKAADAEVVQNTPGGSEGCSSMTDSSLSEDATDWGEDSDLEHDVQLHLSDSGRLLAESQKPLIQDVLDPMKKEIVDRLMEEFWIIFNRNWPMGSRLCPAAHGNNSPSTSRSVSGSEIPSVIYSGGRLGAYEGSDKGDKEHPDDRPGEGSGEPSKPPESTSTTSQPIGFACPYRKRNPRKYCVRDWRSCALNPLKTVARVKGHLYKYHIIHQCQRCKCLLKSEEELDSHIETSERCDAILAPPVDGIARKMKAVLQCKRKAFRGQTEAERWKQIYQILFPDDKEVPDPYFEPVRDNEDSGPHSLDLADLSSYEQFLRHSLPRLVRSALEMEINNDIQPIEERLREQLPDLVEHALSRAFLEYRTMADSNQNGNPSVDSGYISNHSRSASSQDRKGRGPAIGPRAETSMLSTTYLNDAFESSDTLSSPFIGNVLTSNLEISVPLHQSFEDMGSSEHLQFQEDITAQSLSSERLFSSNPSFPDQLRDPISNMMDMDSFNWELPLQEDPCSNY